MNILESIEHHKEDFSKAELKICDYILKEPEAIEAYTITKMASICQVSTSAVLRFCKTLGFHGYKDFRFEMIKYLHDSYQVQPFQDLFDELSNEYLKIISQFKKINRETLCQLTDAIKHSRIVYIIGIYYSSLPARQLCMGLKDMGITAIAAYDYVDAAHLYNNISQDSVCILFSISGSKTYIKHFLVDLDERIPENSFLITLNAQSPLQKSFPHNIVLPGNELTNKSIVNTESIFMCFVEIILNLLHNNLNI